MKILKYALMKEFIAYLKSNWGRNSRVNQRRRRLRQLVAMVRGVADAAEGRRAVLLRGGSLNVWQQRLRWEALHGQAVLDATSNPSAVASSAKKFLAGIRALFVCSPEVGRLTDTVEGLERLTGPGADLDLFLKVLQLDTAMDVDVDVAAAAPYVVDQGRYFVSVSAAAGHSVPGVDQAEAGDATSHGRPVDRAPLPAQAPGPHVVMCKEQHRSGTPPAGPKSSLAVAMQMARVRRRIGKPNLDQRLSRISLQ